MHARTKIGLGFAAGVAVSIGVIAGKASRDESATIQTPAIAQAAPVAPLDATPRDATPRDAATDASADAPADAAIAAIVVTASKLFADYRDNELAADALYKDRPVRITGVVRGIAKDDGGKPFIGLAAGGAIANVKALMVDAENLTKPKRGNEVRLYCHGAGTQHNAAARTTFPVLVGCVLEAYR